MNGVEKLVDAGDIAAGMGNYKAAQAYAALAMACALDDIAIQLKYLGTGTSGSEMGALEFVAAAIKEGLGEIASAIEALGC